MSCNIEDVIADGEVSGDAVYIDGAIYATDWREVRVKDFYCECGEYFNEEELIKHLGLEEK